MSQAQRLKEMMQRDMLQEVEGDEEGEEDGEGKVVFAAGYGGVKLEGKGTVKDDDEDEIKDEVDIAPINWEEQVDGVKRVLAMDVSPPSFPSQPLLYRYDIANLLLIVSPKPTSLSSSTFSAPTITTVSGAGSSTVHRKRWTLLVDVRERRRTIIETGGIEGKRCIGWGRRRWCSGVFSRRHYALVY